MEPGGPDIDRVAQILTARRDGEADRGSGYRMSRDIVMTAAHVVSDAESVRVRLVARSGAVTELNARVLLVLAGLDLALLRAAPAAAVGGDRALKHVSEAGFGRLDEAADCVSVGFPRFKMRKGSEGEKDFRDISLVRGRAEPLSDLREGTLELHVDPPEHDPDPRRTAWEGMSGAAVSSAGRIIGIVS
jgi:hypothetical protein